MDQYLLSLIPEQSFIMLWFTSNFTKKTLNEAWKSCCGRASDRVSSCCCFDGGFGEWWRFSRSTMAKIESNVPDHNMKNMWGLDTFESLLAGARGSRWWLWRVIMVLSDPPAPPGGEFSVLGSPTNRPDSSRVVSSIWQIFYLHNLPGVISTL